MRYQVGTFSHPGKGARPRRYPVEEFLSGTARRLVKARRRVAVPRAPRAEAPRAVNVRWSMDFMRDVTVRGGAFRTLNVVDDGSRECLAIEVDTSLPGSRGVRLQFIEPGRPMQNPYVESFNGKFRDECLNEHWFLDVPEARRITGAWRVEYNEVRPHSALGNLTPAEFASRLARGHLQDGGARPSPPGERDKPL